MFPNKNSTQFVLYMKIQYITTLHFAFQDFHSKPTTLHDFLHSLSNHKEHTTKLSNVLLRYLSLFIHRNASFLILSCKINRQICKYNGSSSKTFQHAGKKTDEWKIHYQSQIGKHSVLREFFMISVDTKPGNK